MRVAFTVFGGSGWTGGINYLENLLSALFEEPDSNVTPVLFASADTDPEVLTRLSRFLVEPPVLSSAWNNGKVIRWSRLICAYGLQRDYIAEKEFRRADIDVVFQHSAWYGCRFKIPTLAWIADFQHRYLPKMFSKSNYYWREAGYSALSRCATRIMVSSKTAKKDCESLYPESKGRVDAVPFAVRAGDALSGPELMRIRKIYNLPPKFFFMPNQFWRHKNHLNVIEALNIVGKMGGEIVIVASGNLKDGRNPNYPQRVLDLVTSYGMSKQFVYLGFIPVQHIIPLVRLSVGVINPSFFEGWSTTVEEAKAVGAPLLLSDLPIHREQIDGSAAFFDPHDPEDIAEVLSKEWSRSPSGRQERVDFDIAEKNRKRRRNFALAFGESAAQTYAQILGNSV